MGLSENQFFLALMHELTSQQFRAILWSYRLQTYVDYYQKAELNNSGRIMTVSLLMPVNSIQPQVPLRLPCYDFTPVEDPTVVCANKTTRYSFVAQKELFGSFMWKWYTEVMGDRKLVRCFGRNQFPGCDGRCVQGPGTYSPRHADPRLLAIPT